MAAGAIHLHDKYSKEIEQAFYKESVVKGLLSKKYGWIGVQTVKISTLVSQDLNTYDRTASSNRYGTPTEMTEIVQLMKLTQEPSFSITIDKGNNKDQHNIKGAARALAVQIREKCTPNYDKYVLAALATKAGKIYGVSTDVSASNIADRIMTGTASLDDAEAPDSGRLLYISAAKFKLLKLCDEYVALEKTGTKALVKGEVGEFDGMRVIKVPSGRWPSGVNFMIVHKEAACAPVKLDDTKVHVDPPGISGNLLEGRQYLTALFSAPSATACMWMWIRTSRRLRGLPS